MSEQASYIIRSDRAVTCEVAGVKLVRGIGYTSDPRVANAAALAGLRVTNSATGLTVQKRPAGSRN